MSPVCALASRVGHSPMYAAVFVWQYRVYSCVGFTVSGTPHLMYIPN